MRRRGVFSEARTPALWHRRKRWSLTILLSNRRTPVTYWDRQLWSSLLHLFLTVTLGAKPYDPYLLKRKTKLSKCWLSGWLLSLALHGTLRCVNPKHPVLRLRLAKMGILLQSVAALQGSVLFQGRDSFCSFLCSQGSARLCLPTPGVGGTWLHTLLLTLQLPRPCKLLNRSLQHRMAEACWKFYPNPQTKVYWISFLYETRPLLKTKE